MYNKIGAKCIETLDSSCKSCELNNYSNYQNILIVVKIPNSWAKKSKLTKFWLSEFWSRSKINLDCSDVINTFWSNFDCFVTRNHTIKKLILLFSTFKNVKKHVNLHIRISVHQKCVILNSFCIIQTHKHKFYQKNWCTRLMQKFGKEIQNFVSKNETAGWFRWFYCSYCTSKNASNVVCKL